MIDNYDSFTYNLVQYIGELGQQMKVFRNDKVSASQIRKLNPKRIVISPGPGNPRNAGISKNLISEFGKRIPVLGVCLGHQCIGEVFGANIVQAKRIMHGKTSPIFHNDHPLFKDLDNPFTATRYHSLIIDPKSLPPTLRKTAWTDEDEIMGVCHVRYPIMGVQFHPESILTVQGKILIKNFLKI